MAKMSAGLLLYRQRQGQLEIFLVHPGGPFWEKKDLGSWSIPKGEFTPDEDPLTVAKREFQEETSFSIEGIYTALTPLRQPSGKTVYAWTLEGDCDAKAIKSNTFSSEWPPKSGKFQDFPEVDRAGWFSIEGARKKILKGQVGFIEQLLDHLGERSTIKGSEEEPQPKNKNPKSESDQQSLFD